MEKREGGNVIESCNRLALGAQYILNFFIAAYFATRAVNIRLGLKALLAILYEQAR